MNAKTSLSGGALAGLGASLCCLGPLALVSLGVSGAWISNLVQLEPYRWLFVIAALGFMGQAWKKIYRPPAAAECQPEAQCTLPETNRLYSGLFWIVCALVLSAIVFPYFVPLFL